MMLYKNYIETFAKLKNYSFKNYFRIITIGGKIPNHKHQITNKSQAPSTKQSQAPNSIPSTRDGSLEFVKLEFICILEFY